MLKTLKKNLKKIPFISQIKAFLYKQNRRSKEVPKSSLVKAGKHPNSWPSLRASIKKYALAYEVVNDIHHADYIFRFILDNSPTYTEAIKNYFHDGHNSAKKLANILADLEIKQIRKTSLLEFASGYGMVTRHLIKELNPIRITSCDIHEQATEFLNSRMDVEVILSQSIPENIDFKETFDVVFALSFFSHMPDTSFGRWLKTLYRAVKPNGYFIFTTHGNASTKHINCEIPESGIWFKPISEQKDLNMNEYGTSCVSLNYVERQVKQHLHTNIFSYKEAAWWEHQDLYIIKKEVSERVLQK